MNAIPIHAFNPGPITGAGNWTWLVPGRVPTLIDAGTGDPRHLEALAGALGGVPLAQVLVTHGHTDHASGAPAIAACMPSVRFRKMPWPERDEQWPVPWEPISGGDRIEAGDTYLVAVHTPGHAPDHLCLWHEETRTLFCGDLAVKGSSVWIPTNLSGDLAQYLASLRTVLALQPARMLPAHGAVIDDPQAVLRAYLEHRLAREQQVLTALRNGDATPDAIVAHLYRGTTERLIPLARESVIAHLVKLEQEGRVRRDGEAWHIMDA